MTMKRILTLIIGLALIAPAWSADDDPIPAVETAELTRLEDAGFTVRVAMTPVVKSGGTNIASVDKIIVERWAKRRKLVNGVQVGDARPVKIDERDCTAWFMARTNAVTGLPVSLNIAPDRGSWAQLAYRQSAPVGE